MSHLLTCQALSKSFGAESLFENINLVIHQGDQIGLIGPNGSGKSTFLKIVCERLDPDGGKIIRRKNVRTAYLDQSDSFDEEASVEDNLDAILDVEGLDAMERHSRVQALLSRAEFADPTVAVKYLSGGWRKRLAICCTLVLQPTILVLDEPTNHLDIEGILWLEKILSGGLGGNVQAALIVSHDRKFLENVANRIVEISPVYPDGSLQVKGNYSKYLQERVSFLENQQRLEERLANKMRREAEWLARGPKARATKAQYRIDEAGKLKAKLDEVQGRNRALQQVRIDFSATGRKTKKLLHASQISKQYDGRTLFSALDMVLSPGSRLGLLGNNGCGKSTLMKILAASASDDQMPDSGELFTAPDVRIVSFDQKREGIDPAMTLRRALAPEGDAILYRGESIHVVSWASRFLFRASQLETPVGQLSGGEQARILIAELMRQPADILLLDEPTNDLDIPSLNVLEERLQEFPGALVLVTHDRYLLDSVCDQVLGFDNLGGVSYFADYEQWIADLQKKENKKGAVKEKAEPKKVSSKKKTGKVGKLSYMDQREYDQMEAKIMEAEEEKESLQALLNDPKRAQNPQELEELWSQVEELTQQIEKFYERWDELEEKKLAG